MRNIKLTISYIGTAYLGWQVQPQGPTIQSLIQDALLKILQEKIVVLASGRTDSGVHALAQVAHFKTSHAIDLPTLHRALNGVLPNDVAIVSVEEVGEDFHAQKSAIDKTYQYFILNSEHKNPFLNPYIWWIRHVLDVEAMQRCLDLLVGRHDFAAFKAADSCAKTSVREILEARIGRGVPLLRVGAYCNTPLQSYAILTITLKGRGFLKHMVRNIVGTLVDVGKGKTTVEDFQRIFVSCDRKQAGITAPARGLFLVEVNYM